MCSPDCALGLSLQGGVQWRGEGPGLSLVEVQEEVKGGAEWAGGVGRGEVGVAHPAPVRWKPRAGLMSFSLAH